MMDIIVTTDPFLEIISELLNADVRLDLERPKPGHTAFEQL